MLSYFNHWLIISTHFRALTQEVLMSQSIHAMKQGDALAYRVWSDTTGEYVTDVLDEAGLRAHFLRQAIARAIQEELFNSDPFVMRLIHQDAQKRTDWDSSLSSSDESDEEENDAPAASTEVPKTSEKKAARLAKELAQLRKAKNDAIKTQQLADVALEAILEAL